MHLTDTAIDALKPRDKHFIVWDDQVVGLGVRVTKTGAKAFVVDHTTAAGRRRRLTLGLWGVLTVEQARAEALKFQAASTIDSRRKLPSRSDRMTAEQRKAQIIEVTRRLIANEGLERATTGRIAAEAHVTEPTLYRHFGSRKGLLSAVLRNVLESAAATLESQHPNALEGLREIGKAHNQATLDREGIADPLFEFVTAPSSLGLREALKNSDFLLDRLLVVIERGRAQGTIRSDVPAIGMAWQMLMFFWAEDVAYLMGAKEEVLSGLSLRTLDAILRDMAPQPAHS